MRVRGALEEGNVISLQFFGQEDLKQDEHANEAQPVSWTSFALSESEARSLLTWLRGARSVHYEGSRLRATGAEGSVMMDFDDANATIHLGVAKDVDALVKELSGTLSLGMGRGVDPSEEFGRHRPQ